jgi:hypothetical protein
LRNSEFSDLSDEELIRVSGDVFVAGINSNVPCNQTSRFKPPISSDAMAAIVAEKFVRKTIDESTWAVSLFSQWRADRNVRCQSDSSSVYLDKPFGLMSDDELNYSLPMFLTEVTKKDGSDYPPATLRDLILSLQKFMEIIGRIVKFLSDDKFRDISDIRLMD